MSLLKRFTKTLFSRIHKLLMNIPLKACAFRLSFCILLFFVTSPITVNKTKLIAAKTPSAFSALTCHVPLTFLATFTLSFSNVTLSYIPLAIRLLRLSGLLKPSFYVAATFVVFRK